VGTLARPALGAGGIYGAWRAGGRFRLGLALLAGEQADRTAGRGEILANFLLAPRRTHGPSLYAMGGVAAQVGARDRGFLMVGLGLESAPGGRDGWALEAGVGGGARLAAGYRWRWFTGR
jgi:hypothetical protein